MRRMVTTIAALATLTLVVAAVATREASAANACGSRELWINDLAYGSAGGGVYWDPVSSMVWTSENGWHYFSPNPPRANPQPLWVNQLDYGSYGRGFYWDPVSGQVWTAEQGWHVYGAHGCGFAPGSGGLTLRSAPSRSVPPPAGPVSSPGAQIRSADFVAADCEGTCQAIRITFDVAYTLAETQTAGELSIRFTPTTVYGRCLTSWSEPSEPLFSGTGTALAKTTLRFMGCPGESVVFDEIYSLQIYLASADGASGPLARIELPFFADVMFVRSAPPAEGTITLMTGDSFDSFTGVRGSPAQGDFYYSDGSGHRDPRFWANNRGQRGLVDVGDIQIKDAPIPASGYTSSVPVIVGHTYVSLAAEGHEGKYVVFRVTSLSAIGVTLHWVLR